MHIENKFNKIHSQCTRMEKKKNHNIAKHQRVHRLIAIELIENKLDENKKSIELTVFIRLFISLLEIPTCAQFIHRRNFSNICFQCIILLFGKRFMAISILIFPLKSFGFSPLITQNFLSISLFASYFFIYSVSHQSVDSIE